MPSVAVTLPPALSALAPYAQFIIYRLAPHPTKPGALNKQPCDWRTGRIASLMDPSNWTDYGTAAANHARADSGHGTGVGFVFTPQDPFFFVDVDKARLPNGQWSAGALALAARLPGAAVETSVSGSGFHIIAQGACPPHSAGNEPFSDDPADGSAALYTEGRFVALTLANLAGDAGTDHTVTMQALVPERFAPRPGAAAATDGEWTTEPDDGYDPALADDAMLLTRARKAVSAAGAFSGAVSFAALWDGDEPTLAAAYPPDGASPYDASRADAALASHLAFWTGRDCERIQSLMEQSALRRDKWDDRPGYLETTILKARALSERIPRPKPPPPPVTTAPPPPVPSAAPPAPRVYQISADQAKDKADHQTIEYFLAASGRSIRYDEFARVVRVDGEALTDPIERELWLTLRETASLKFAWDLFDHTLRRFAHQQSYHPLREYLAARQVEWDGTPRVDRWLTDYLGVADSPYARCVGALFLTALVRRARQPGAKFDEMLVLEGPQGAEKSSALAALCEHEEWFTDEVSVGMTSKELLEVTGGKWIVEAPELKGLVGRGVDHVKAFLSRRHDKARMAFERNSVELGREWVPAATTNDSQYLDDPTGNRRIWPVVVTAVRLDALRAVRGQLWAEAATREAAGASIRMPRELWADAADHQAQRVLPDTFGEALDGLLGDKTGRVRGMDVLFAAGIQMDQQTRYNRRLGETMRKLGWESKPVRVDGKLTKFYVRGDPARSIIIAPGGRALEYATTQISAVS